MKTIKSILSIILTLALISTSAYALTSSGLIFEYTPDGISVITPDDISSESELLEHELIKALLEQGFEYDEESGFVTANPSDIKNIPQPKKEFEGFDDVDYSHWAYYYIQKCYENSIMMGTSETLFAPDALMSVAEAITAAVRLSGNGNGISQNGSNWYDGYVESALSHNIIKNGQFDNYDRPVTRSEMAGLMGVALGDSAYTQINKIDYIPDVDETTPYSNEIFKLYRAGVLTGSDGMGSFLPYDDIKRAEVSALLCRAVLTEMRKSISILEPPSDLQVYSTSKKLSVCGIDKYGVLEIGGKYFIPADALYSRQRENRDDVIYFYDSDSDYTLRIGTPVDVTSAITVDCSFAPVPDRYLGTAKVASKPLSCYNSGEYPDTQTYGAVYTLDGNYPLISLEAMGAVDTGDGFAVGKVVPNISKEVDLVGNALPYLQRDSVSDTALAIHDYIVNSLIYNPLVEPAYYMTQADIDAADAALTAAEEAYTLPYNITLASGYGVCADYAELYQEMCIRSGIPCYTVLGSASSGGYMIGHAWNRTYIDGEWKFVDCTWDDPLSNKQELSHSYYRISADKLANSHIWGGDDYPLPDNYDPAWENIDPNNITSADMFRKCLVAQLVQGKTNFSLRGVYGGTACIYNYDVWFASMRSGYNSSTGAYDFEVSYGF